PIEQRRIRALGRFGDDVVEISDGLVVVDAEAQREDVVAHERTTPAARLLAIEIPVDHGGRESLGFHEAAQLLDEGDRSVTAAGAPDGHGQIRLALALVRRESDAARAATA